jgi:hypothetical protein
MAAERSMLEMILRTRKEGTGARDAKKELSGLRQTAKKLSIGLGAVGAAAVTTGLALKKAFDLGREGAVVVQTTESFAFLLEKIGAAPELLDDLRASAQSTVSDLELMSSTAVLLAGASDDLAPALAASTPELLEIAKAANKLNPALGDTTFLYQSIAKGIKRASPLILDNLGLNIKLGAAFQAMATELGKSVEALTAEERSLAILNDTLRAGKVIIDQVGGSTAAATDDFDRLDASVQNLTNEFKAALVPALSDAASGAEALLGLLFRLDDIFAEHEENVFETSETYGDYIKETVRAALGAGQLTKEQARLILKFQESGKHLESIAIWLDRANIKTEEQFDIFKQAEPAIDGWSIALEGGQWANLGLAEATDEANIRIKEQRDFMKQAEQTVDGWSIALMGGQSAIEGLGEATDKNAGEAKEQVNALARAARQAGSEFSDLSVASDLTWTSISTGVDGAIRSLLDNIAFLAGGGAEIVTQFENVKQAMDEGLIPPDKAIPMLEDLELAVIGVKEEVGLISTSEATRQVAEEFNVSWQEAGRLIDSAKTKIDEIPDKIEKELLIRIAFMQQTIPLPEFQFGGTVPGRIGMPQLVVAHGGEEIRTPQQVTHDNRRELKIGEINIADPLSDEALDQKMRDWMGV